VILKSLFARRPNSAEALYAAIVAAARRPKFYAELSVPDTVDGRFDMIVLHMFLVLRRLKDETPELCQNLTDTFFKDMDRSLREMGVGDLSVGKKVRKMAEAFHGRLNAYAKALGQGDTALAESLERNVYAGEANLHAPELANWVRATEIILSTQETTKLTAAKVVFHE
jgi:cytochrome b pre-mRNA-processing protein 3